MLERLYNLDVKILLLINRHYNPEADKVMYFVSGTASWIPFYALLLVLLIIKYKRESMLMIAAVVPQIILSDQISSGIVKPLVHRLRPSHQPGLEYMLHYVQNYQGGSYGFVSSHAANTFGLAMLLTLIASRRLPWLPYIMFPWAALCSYSRMYLGVHYPSDVLAGAIIGVSVAWGISRLYFFVKNRKAIKAV